MKPIIAQKAARIMKRLKNATILAAKPVSLLIAPKPMARI